MAESIKSIIVPEEAIVSKIYLIRDQKVMLDRDLAELYGVETKRLKEQVNRNLSRFPAHFMFELSKDENENLRSQNATLRSGITFYLITYAIPCPHTKKNEPATAGGGSWSCY